MRKNDHAAEIAAALTAAGVPHRWAGPMQNRPVFKTLFSALLLAADETAGIVGLTTLSPAENLGPDFPLSESDRRTLFAEGRGKGKARPLLAAATRGEIAGLSHTGQAQCQRLLELALALSPTAKATHNLGVYLFEYARWIRALWTDEARREHPARVALATAGQILDLAAAFALQREALARGIRERAAEDAEKDAHDEPESVEMETSVTAFVAYLRAALQTGDLGVPNELDAGGDAVPLMTAHRSKGLEWPVVFVPFCVEGQFPAKEREDDLPLPPGLIARDDADPTAAHQREEACLFYVAVTRARDVLHLCGAEKYGVRAKGEISALSAALCAGLPVEAVVHITDAPPVVEAAATEGMETETTETEKRIPYLPPSHGTWEPGIRESALSVYADCPRKFLFRFIYGLPEPDTAFLEFHNVVYGAAREASADGAARSLRDCFEARWREDGPPESHWQTPILRRAAEKMMRQMERGASGGAKSAFRQEKTLHLGLSAEGVPLIVRLTVDEIVTDADGKRAFRRHRQSAKLPKNPPDDDRMTLYALAADAENANAVVHYPQIDEQQTPKIGPVRKNNLKTNLLQMVQEIAAGNMTANPKADCARCSFALICRSAV